MNKVSGILVSAIHACPPPIRRWIAESFLGFDEEWYLYFNKDVSNAVNGHLVSSGLEHFLAHGVYEKRRYKKPDPIVDCFSDIVLRIETTNACNLSCNFCPHCKMNRKVETMDGELYRLIIQQGAEMKIHTLDLRNFGEPLIDKELDRRCDYAHNHGFDNIYIHTNGILLTKEKYLNLCEAGMKTFIVSLSPEKEFNETRGYGYEIIINNLKNIMSICNENNVLIDYINTGRSTGEEVQDFKQELEEIGVSLREKIQLHNWAHGSCGIGLSNFCERLWNSFTVLADGRVALCCLDYDGENIVGDIKKNNLKEIINSSSYLSYRVAMIHHEPIGLCRNCDMAYVKY